MARPRHRYYEGDPRKPGSPDTIAVSVRFTVEQLAEIDLRADALDISRNDYIKMEFLKGIGWIERKRAQLQERQAEVKKKLEA